jgi:hypothetical protein
MPAAVKPIPSAVVNASAAALVRLAPWSCGRLAATAFAWPIESFRRGRRGGRREIRGGPASPWTARQQEGADAFVKSWDDLLQNIRRKAGALTATR